MCTRGECLAEAGHERFSVGHRRNSMGIACAELGQHSFSKGSKLREAGIACAELGQRSFLSGRTLCGAGDLRGELGQLSREHTFSAEPPHLALFRRRPVARRMLARMKIAIVDDYQDAVRGLACFAKLAVHSVQVPLVARELQKYVARDDLQLLIRHGNEPDPAPHTKQPRGLRWIRLLVATVPALEYARPRRLAG